MLGHEEERLAGQRWEEEVPGRLGALRKGHGPDGSVGVGVGGGDEQ